MTTEEQDKQTTEQQTTEQQTATDETQQQPQTKDQQPEANEAVQAADGDQPQPEAIDYDAKIAHLALSRIDIDLDDGVKVNYAKLGELLTKIK